MNCRIITMEEFREDFELELFVRRNLTRPDSDFQKALYEDSPLGGHIALVEDHGEVIGWARTDTWQEKTPESWRVAPLMLHWNTLEAFVAQDWRGRGVATFAVAGLVAAEMQNDPTVAVFRPNMMLLASKVGLEPTLFRQDEKTKMWARA
jgi:GNAT superfamily N-acetyltransferase